MNKFDFYQDVKVTVWQRQHFSIEAETAEEARELAKQYTDKDISTCDEVEADEIEWLYDTEEHITPEENGGCATIEVYEREGKYEGTLIADNAVSKDLSAVETYRKLIGYQSVDCNGSYPVDFDDHEEPWGEQDTQDYMGDETDCLCYCSPYDENSYEIEMR